MVFTCGGSAAAHLAVEDHGCIQGHVPQALDEQLKVRVLGSLLVSDGDTGVVLQGTTTAAYMYQQICSQILKPRIQ